MINEELKYWTDRAPIIMMMYHSMNNSLNPLQDEKRSEYFLQLAITTGLIEIFNERKRTYKTKYFILNQSNYKLN